MKSTVTAIRNQEKTRNPTFFDRIFVSFFISSRLSPWFSAWFIQKKIAPDLISILMTATGVLGGILFAAPGILPKIVSFIMLNIWFILDLSDGEVARQTKNYSKYGKQLDLIAHTLVHPSAEFGFAVGTLTFFRGLDQTLLLSLFCFHIVSELVIRVHITLMHFSGGENTKTVDFEGKSVKSEMKRAKKIIHAVIDFFAVYPNFAVLFPLVFFVAFLAGINILFIYLILCLVFSVFSAANLSIKLIVKYCFKSK